MQCHVELGIMVKGPVSKEDTELLVRMVSGYLSGVGGTPQVNAWKSGDVLCFSVAGMEAGKGSVIRSEQLDKDYARNSVVQGLRESGMHYGTPKKLLPAKPKQVEEDKGEDNDQG